MKFTWFKIKFENLPFDINKWLLEQYIFGKKDCATLPTLPEFIKEWLHVNFCLDNIVQISWGFEKLIIHIFNTDYVDEKVYELCLNYGIKE